MIQIKKTILTLALLLTAATGARAAWTGGTYTATATENLGAITVNGDATLTINSDVTVTVTGGINVASGTLTVTGPGTLVVNGAKGNNGASGWKGSNGSNGGVAISGNIIVQGGATVTATGGNGGKGGNGDMEGGNGGNGGVAIAGTLTYKSGTVTANGGSGGSGGWGEVMERYASSGSAGKAFANDVDFTQTTGYSVTNGTSTIESVLNQRKVVISGGSEPAAPSGPEVAWNKAEKTGTFKMPGGNVTLEPEYYPQAALTAAPTAINDVPATTDGAIVKAGTVATIGSTETAQGTVMYYVSQTALDDAALLALAADQWTADVPTAEKLAQGEAYVYYYVRGNDSDNDEENFSDGDILAANALTVTIAAEPTYAVTFAEGTDPNEWTADPAAGVKKGETVTVTYTGSKKVLGVKAEKKAKAPVEVLTYSFDDASHPSGLTAGSRVSFDYSRTSVITNSKFLNAYNNTNGDPNATTVSLGDTDLSGETWTLSFEWAACGGCNNKPDHTTLKAGDATLFDLSGNSNWNTTVTIIYTGSDGSKTLPVPGCDKSNRFTAAVGDQYNTTTYWHHIVVTGSAEGVKMTITNSSTGAAVVEDVVLSETNVNPTSLIIEPCCGGGIGIDALSLTYEE